MRVVVVLCLLVIVSASRAEAAPHKVLVLPLDGNADVTVRAKLNGTVQKLARTLDATVTVGDTTFDETAAALGCVPSEPACMDTVRTTLGVDELIYGSALSANGTTMVTVRRSGKDTAPRESTTTLSTVDPPERAEPALLLLFTSSGEQVISPIVPPAPPPPPADRRQRNIGIALAGGGGVMFFIGLALWSSASSTQNQIDNHPLENQNDVTDIKALESSTLEYAVIGDIMVIGGLALGSYGAWVLYKDHKARKMLVTPAPMEHGGGIAISGVW